MFYRNYLRARRLFFFAEESGTTVITKSLVTNSGTVVLPVLYECTTSGAALGVLPVPRTSKKLMPALFFWSISVTFERCSERIKTSNSFIVLCTLTLCIKTLPTYMYTTNIRISHSTVGSCRLRIHAFFNYSFLICDYYKGKRPILYHRNEINTNRHLMTILTGILRK